MFKQNKIREASCCRFALLFDRLDTDWIFHLPGIF